MSGYIGTQPVPQATQHREAFTATAGQTSFATAGFTPQFVDVHLNGIKLAAEDYVAENGSDIVLTTGAALNDILEYVAYTPFEVASQTFTGTTTVSDLVATGAVHASDVFITGPTPILTLTDDDVADEYTKIQNAGGGTYIDSRNGTFNGAIILRGQGGGVTDEYARFISNGNFGIGTASPAQAVHVQSTGSATVIAERTGANAGIVGLYASQNPAIVWGTSSDSLRFAQVDDTALGGFSERMRIDTSGNLLVGKTASSLATAGCEQNPVGYQYLTRDGGAALHVRRNTNNGNVVSFYRGGTGVGSISVTGSATAYNTSSDYRLKENITPVQGAADIVKMMQPCTYTFKSDGSWHDGFLAHELQELHPRAVVGSKDAVDEEGNPEYQGVDYSKLTPILTAALQEALNKIDALETRLAALEATP